MSAMENLTAVCGVDGAVAPCRMPQGEQNAVHARNAILLGCLVPRTSTSRKAFHSPLLFPQMKMLPFHFPTKRVATFPADGVRFGKLCLAWCESML